MKTKPRIYTVECIIHNAKKEILMQKKTSDAPFWANGWLLFGGGIDKLTESPRQAIERELKEEMGLTLYPKFYSACEDEDRIVFTYILEMNDISKINLTEGGGFAYWNINDIIEDVDTTPRIKVMLTKWYNGIK